MLIRSVAQQSIDQTHWYEPPVRAPHHSRSAVALVGGGSHPQPGEVSLAHNGVLFLDEFTEFSRHAVEQLREPIESGEINIARARQKVTFPARFLLVAACNPCACGYFGDDRCSCSGASLARYQGKLSGPLLDRIDMYIKVSAVSLAELNQVDVGRDATACSSAIRTRVTAARERQLARQNCLNSQLAATQLDAIMCLSRTDADFLLNACERLRLSARGYYRVKRLALTIADLQNQGQVKQTHLAEALSLRKTYFN